MKTATTISGYITSAAIAFTGALKILHLPGAETALWLTGILLAVYFPLYIIDKMRESSDGKISACSLTAAASALLTDLGITGRLRHWPGADALLISGLVIFSLCFIPLLYVRKLNRPGADKIRYTAGALSLIAFGLGVLFKLEYWSAAPFLLSAFPLLLFAIYFPRLIADHSISRNAKHGILRNSFFTLVIGMLITLYFIKSIEIHDKENVPENGWYKERGLVN